MARGTAAEVARAKALLEVSHPMTMATHATASGLDANDKAAATR
jgi:hypothetical protein